MTFSRDVAGERKVNAVNGAGSLDINTQIGQEIKDRAVKAPYHMCLGTWGKPGGPPAA